METVKALHGTITPSLSHHMFEKTVRQRFPQPEPEVAMKTAKTLYVLWLLAAIVITGSQVAWFLTEVNQFWMGVSTMVQRATTLIPTL